MQVEVFRFGFGDIKLMQTKLSRYYYCYAAQGGFLYLRHAGLSDYDELMNYSAKMVNDDSWKNGAKFFTDLRWVDNREFNFDTYHQLAQDIASLYEKNGRYFCQVVTLCSNDFEFGMHRMFQSAWGDDELTLNTVRDLDEAVESLGIDRELLDEIIAEVDRIESSLNPL